MHNAHANREKPVSQPTQTNTHTHTYARAANSSEAGPHFVTAALPLKTPTQADTTQQPATQAHNTQPADASSAHNTQLADTTQQALTQAHNTQQQTASSRGAAARDKERDARSKSRRKSKSMGTKDGRRSPSSTAADGAGVCSFQFVSYGLLRAITLSM